MKIIIALIALAIIFFLVCVVVSAITYIYEEICHTVKNLKRSVRELWWGVEWKWNHR